MPHRGPIRGRLDNRPPQTSFELAGKNRGLHRERLIGRCHLNPAVRALVFINPCARCVGLDVAMIVARRIARDIAGPKALLPGRKLGYVRRVQSCRIH